METILTLTTSAIAGISAAILTVWYTRKNLKSTQYIETIITERINWINLLRNDFSILITSILVFRSNTDKLHETQFESERLDYVRHLTRRDVLEDDQLQKDYESRNLIHDINTAIEKCLTPAELVVKATQIKLRLDLTKYKEISEILEFVIAEYSVIGFNFNDSKVDTTKLTALAQSMLTTEWNEIINEVETK